MPDASTKTRSPHWVDHFPWLILTRSFSLSKAVHVMVLGRDRGDRHDRWLAAVRVLSARRGSWTLTSISNKTSSFFGNWPANRVTPVNPLTGGPSVRECLGDVRQSSRRSAPGRARIERPSRSFVCSNWGYNRWVDLYYGMGLAWTLLVWSFFGCAFAAWRR